MKGLYSVSCNKIQKYDQIIRDQLKEITEIVEVNSPIEASQTNYYKSTVHFYHIMECIRKWVLLNNCLQTEPTIHSNYLPIWCKLAGILGAFLLPLKRFFDDRHWFYW